MAGSKKYYFSVRMPYAECESLYYGSILYVLMTADTGERVQVPAINVRKFIDSRGLVGRFVLTTNTDNKIVTFERIS